MIIFAVIWLLLNTTGAHFRDTATTTSSIFKILIGDGSVVGIDVAVKTGRRRNMMFLGRGAIGSAAMKNGPGQGADLAIAS